ncbi:MAG: nuclear transport factor 2 family protein [Kiritimatiellae bacterium]|nr:nuclear transport factor 2 family protein [Kiritimatiellia bacterium]MDY0148465.1 nuclear transport factor 2 family protein [Kiritimatiellia bacterium]
MSAPETHLDTTDVTGDVRDATARNLCQPQTPSMSRIKPRRVIALFAAVGLAIGITMQAATAAAPGEPMASEHQMRIALQAYIDLFNRHDGRGLAALFADHARIEDPVGGATIVEGRTAINEFYRRAVTKVDRLELVAPIRTSYGAAAAMAFDIHMQADGHPLLIRVIDVMTFDAHGKIVDMKAYHGPSDRETDDAATP